MMSETKAAGPTAITVDVFQELLNKTAERIERAAIPVVQPMELRSFGELERWAEMAARSKMVPKDYQGQPENIILAVQMGSEVGLRPMQSLQNIAVINGRPAIWGDALLALCKTHPLYVSIQEIVDGNGDAMTAKCTVVRRGEPPFIQTFSVEDAKIAKLWNKRGRDGQDTPWVTSPKRMLQMRARGFALRDAFPDKLKGLISAEEADDYEVPQMPMSAAPSVTPAKAETPRRTISDFLDQLDIDLAAAQTAQDYDTILARDDVQKALDTFRNGAKEHLQKALDAARLRTADDFPGVVTKD